MSENDQIFVDALAEEPKKKNKSKKKGKAGKVIAIILLCCLIGSLTAVGGVTLYNKYIPAIKEEGAGAIFGRSIPDSDSAEKLPADEEILPLPEEAQEPVVEKSEPKTSAKASESEALSAADVYEKNVNSTVGITITGTVNYWGYQSQYAASGSGFIVSEDGYILTNYHVIEGSQKVTVTTYDDNTYNATVIGYDDKNDIAVLKIEGEGFVPVTIGNSDSLRVGDQVLAIGNPLGELTFSLTQGIVSALNRNVTMSDGTSMKLIQTDCAINSGNSGGALFNMNGEVIGITNAKYSSDGNSSEASIDNIGFAIPINNVWEIVTSIVEKGYISKPYIGVSVGSVSDDVKNVTGIESGAIVYDVTEGGPAEKAGIQVNDIITSVNGEKIESSDSLVDMIGSAEPGDVIEVELYRQGETVNVKVEVGEQVQDALQNQDSTQNQNNQQNMPNQGQQQYGYGYGYGNGNDNNGNGNGSDSFEDYFGFGSMGDIFRYYFGY